MVDNNALLTLLTMTFTKCTASEILVGTIAYVYHCKFISRTNKLYLSLPQCVLKWENVGTYSGKNTDVETITFADN